MSKTESGADRWVLLALSPLFVAAVWILAALVVALTPAWLVYFIWTGNLPPAMSADWWRARWKRKQEERASQEPLVRAGERLVVGDLIWFMAGVAWKVRRQGISPAGLCADVIERGQGMKPNGTGVWVKEE